MRLALIFIFLPFALAGQLKKEISNEERAYLYHTVKNSPILEKSFGRYFNFTGRPILFPNKTINYDSLGNFITAYPDSLLIYTHELAKAPKGLLTEAVNKVALWKLNRLLAAKRGTPSELEPYKEEYEEFAKILVRNLPPAALSEEQGKTIPHPKLDKVLNPMLGFDDKTAMLGSFQFLNVNDQLTTINAITKSINEYLTQKTLILFEALEGQHISFSNVNVAVGDGTISSPTFEDRESNDKSKWISGIPKTVGVIPFQAKYTQGSGAIASKIDPYVYSTSDFTTAGDHEITNVHLDVWGYNPEKQVTVIIEKNGLCYPLFNAGTSRFLSPDSSFINGGTFKSKMNQLEFKKIKDLDEMIYGKRGFDYWIAYNTKMKDKTELKIVKLEKKYSDYGYSSVSLSKKKSQKKTSRARNDSHKLNDYNLSNHKEADARKTTQDEIVRQHAIFDEYKRKIKEIEKEKKQALELLALYNRRLDDYKLAFGNHWAKYKEKHGIYTFEDSTTFNIFTQEFHFPAKGLSEPFEIRVLSIPEECLSNNYDEVMMHINVVDEIPNYDAKLNIQLIDEFTTNQWKLNTATLNSNDSIALIELLDACVHLKKKLSVSANGQGVGIWNGSQVVKDIAPVKGNSSIRLDSNYRRLQKAEILATIDKKIHFSFNTYTDSKEPNIAFDDPLINQLKTQHKLSNNDILTVYRTAVLIQAFKKEILQFSQRNLTADEFKTFERKIAKVFSKINIGCGKTTIKLSDLKL